MSEDAPVVVVDDATAVDEDTPVAAPIPVAPPVVERVSPKVESIISVVELLPPPEVLKEVGKLQVAVAVALSAPPLRSKSIWQVLLPLHSSPLKQ